MNNAITQTPSADRYGWTDGRAGEGGKEGRTRGKKEKAAQIGNEKKKQERRGEEGEKQTGMAGAGLSGGAAEQEKTSAPGENSDGLSRGRALFTLLVSDSELRLLNNTITAAAHR